MGREKKPPDKPDDIPAWFMTYSDVITLLMTFFILLMTFATNEPERFERMQVSMFGGSGATGLAGRRRAGWFDGCRMKCAWLPLHSIEEDCPAVAFVEVTIANTHEQYRIKPCGDCSSVSIG